MLTFLHNKFFTLDYFVLNFFDKSSDDDDIIIVFIVIIIICYASLDISALYNLLTSALKEKEIFALG